MSQSDPQQLSRDAEPNEAEAAALASRQSHLEAVRDELMQIEHTAQAEIKKREAELERALDELEAAEQELAVALEDLRVVRGNATTSATTSVNRSAV